MRITRRKWLIITAIVSLFAAAGIVPIIHPLKFAHDDIVIRGIFPTHGGRQGFQHGAVRDSQGNLIFRAYGLRLGPVAWELTLNYWHS